MATKQHGDLDSKYDNYDYPTVSINNQTGHPGHTNPQENAAVHQLRQLLEQEGCKDRLDTLTLLRFLRARKFDVQLSKQMFLDTEKWRKEFKVDQLMKDFTYPEKEEVFKYYPQYYHKTDKDGRPVYIEQLGKIDLNKMYKITTKERLLSSLVVEYEKFADPRLPACSRKADALIETSCTIIDLKGVGLSNASSAVGYVREASGISQNNYPERMGRMLVINAPWGFSTIFSMIKGFLDPVTQSKISVLGSGYLKDVLAQIPAENLPKSLGGKCECEGSCQLADPGPWRDPQWARPAAWEKEASATTASAPAPSQEPVATHTGAQAGSESVPTAAPTS